MTDTTRTFEFKDDKSSKFWEVTQSGSTVKVRFGKTGANGQSQEKAFADEAAASKHVQKLIAEKTGKGYVEQGTNTVTSVDAAGAIESKEPAVSEPAKAEAKQKAVKSVKPKSPVQDPEATPQSLMAFLDKDDATNRLLAKHPRASAELLEKLSHSSDKATRQAVAGNPNTPSKVLQKLGAQFPTQLLSNPALDLMVLENPGLFSEIPEETLTALAKREDCPPDMLGYLARAGHGKGLLMSLLQNGATPKSAIEYLFKSSAEVLAERYEVPEDQVRKIKTLVPMHVAVASPMNVQEAEDRLWLDLAVRLGLSQEGEWELISNADIPESVLHDAIAFALLYQPRLLPITMPAALLELIATKVDKRTLTAVKEIKNFPEYLKEAKNSEEVATLISKNLSSDDIEWNDLLKTDSLLMRLLLCDHPRCKGRWDREDLMLELAKSPNESILELLATLPNLSEKIGNVLLEKAISIDSYALMCLAGNEAIPSSILIKLHKEYNSLKKKYWNILNVIAENPAIPDVIVDEILSSRNKSAKFNLSSNPSVSSDRLDYLAEKYGSDLYESLVCNLNSSPALLSRIADCEDLNILTEILKNPNSPVEALVKLVRFADMLPFDCHGWMKLLINHKNTTSEVFDALVSNKFLANEDVFEKVAGDPRISSQAMMKILDFKKLDIEIKKKIIRNKSVTSEVLERLSDDKDPDIQKAARLALKKMANVAGGN